MEPGAVAAARKTSPWPEKAPEMHEVEVDGDSAYPKG
jgi:hypothetical protein